MVSYIKMIVSEKIINNLPLRNVSHRNQEYMHTHSHHRDQSMLLH